MQDIAIFFVVGTSVWVFFDARRLGVGVVKEERDGLGGTPFGWFLFCLLFWIFGFPFYLLKRPGFKRTAAARATISPPMLSGPQCPTCRRAHLVLKTNYRMSGPVVLIGWFLLVPSIVGMLWGLYVAIGIPIMAPRLTSDQNAANVAAGLGFGLGLSICIASFVGGLVGWLLVMKKRVLQCPSCSTTIAAS